jgi:hypothetical protein
MVHTSIYIILQGFICAISPVNGLISYQTPIRLKHCLGFQRKLQERSVNQVGMAFMSETQELRPPKAMYTHVVDIGASKAVISPFRTFLMGFYSGCHIAFGAALALGVGIYVYTHMQITLSWLCFKPHMQESLYIIMN